MTLIEEFFGIVVDGLFLLLDFLFGWINIPPFPVGLSNSIDAFLDLIFDNLSLLGFFIRPTTIKIIIPLFCVVISFKYMYKIIMWIVRKIPKLSIK